MITVFTSKEKNCAKSSPRNRNLKKWNYEVINENQAILLRLFLRVFSSDDQEEYKIFFGQCCPKNNYSKWVPLRIHLISLSEIRSAFLISEVSLPSPMTNVIWTRGVQFAIIFETQTSGLGCQLYTLPFIVCHH